MTGEEVEDAEKVTWVRLNGLCDGLWVYGRVIWHEEVDKNDERALHSQGEPVDISPGGEICY